MDNNIQGYKILKLGVLMESLSAFKRAIKAKYAEIDVNEIPICLGNDEELNGFHTAYFVDHIANLKESYVDTSLYMGDIPSGHVILIS